MTNVTNRTASTKNVLNVTIATFGLSHTTNTKIRSDFVRGVSGGELKRVSIAEIFLNGSSFQCWNNSTKSLDSANALKFVKTMRSSTRITESVTIVSLYQASEDIYNVNA